MATKQWEWEQNGIEMKMEKTNINITIDEH